MIVLANGTFKSGSTWQREIISRLTSWDEIPGQYQHPYLPHWINHRKIEAAIADETLLEKNILSKSHLFHPSDVSKLIRSQHCKIFIIKRDVKDTIVSHYYHVKKQKLFNISFLQYYWWIGRYKAIQIAIYNSVWEKNSSKNVLISSYLNLKTNFKKEVKQYSQFLNLSVSEQEVQDIEEATHITNYKKATNPNSWFFRKGKIGDWKAHFDERAIEDIEKIEKLDVTSNDIDIYLLLIESRSNLKNLFTSNRMLYKLFRGI